MKMSDIKSKLREVRATQQDLASFMGVNHRAVFRIVNGERKSLTTVEAEAIRRFFELRERPVVPDKLVNDFAEESSRGTLPRATGGRSDIPLFGGADTPEGWMISLAAAHQVGRIMAHPSQATARRAFAVEVVDDSMSPRFEPGERAYVAAGTMPEKGKYCLLEYKDLTARIVQFVERRERQVIFRQLNPPKQIVLKAGDGFTVHAIVGQG